MPNFFLHIVALLLIPGLIADPVIATSFHSPAFQSVQRTEVKSCVSEQALASILVLAFRKPQNPSAVRLSRLAADILFGLPTVIVAGIILKRLNIAMPGHLPYSLFMGSFFILRTLLAEIWESKRLNPPTSHPSFEETLFISPFLKKLTSVVILGMFIVTLGFSVWMPPGVPPGDFITHHDVWAWIAVIFAMTVFIRGLSVWHRAYFWQEWNGVSIQRIYQMFWIGGILLSAVGMCAGVAHYVLRNDFVYSVRCFYANLPSGLLFLGLQTLFGIAMKKAITTSAGLPLAVQRGYRRIAREMADIIKEWLPVGGVVVIEGRAGSGKTTLGSFLTEHLPRSFDVSLDKFMKSQIHQDAFRRQVLMDNRPVSDAHRSVVRWALMEDFLNKVLGYLYAPGAGARKFTIEEAYPSDKPDSLIVHPGDTAILLGGWPHYIQALRASRGTILTFRVLTVALEAVNRFAVREVGSLSTEELARYYNLAIEPTRAAYEEYATPGINFIIDMTKNPDQWAVVSYTEFIRRAA